MTSQIDLTTKEPFQIKAKSRAAGRGGAPDRKLAAAAFVRILVGGGGVFGVTLNAFLVGGGVAIFLLPFFFSRVDQL